jgi:hypothetical protein
MDHQKHGRSFEIRPATEGGLRNSAPSGARSAGYSGGRCCHKPVGDLVDGSILNWRRSKGQVKSARLRSGPVLPWVVGVPSMQRWQLGYLLAPGRVRAVFVAFLDQPDHEHLWPCSRRDETRNRTADIDAVFNPVAVKMAVKPTTDLVN